MNFMRKHSFFSTLIIVGMIFSAILLITDEDIQKYEHVTIEQGQSLWSLADQYRGKMSKHDWIAQVEKINSINRDNVLAGAVLALPIEKDANYFEQPKFNQDIVKVASEHQ